MTQSTREVSRQASAVQTRVGRVIDRRRPSKRTRLKRETRGDFANTRGPETEHRLLRRNRSGVISAAYVPLARASSVCVKG
jgi:hypothetical protein